VTLAACGANVNPDASADPAAPGPDGETERVYVEGISGEPLTLVSNFSASPYIFRFAYSMMEPLVGVSDDFELIPMLAEDWSFSDDNLEVTLHLREGVTWHDGEPFTSDDVVFNFEEIMPLEPFGAPLVENIASIDAPDENTVVLTMTSEYGPLLETLATQFMLPKHVYEGSDYLTHEANFAPTGTGPYVFDEFVSGEYVTVVKNTDWWGGDVAADRVIFRIIVDGEARALSFFSGEVDTTTVSTTRLGEVEADPDLRQTDGGEFPSWIYFAMNARSEPLDDPEVRKLIYSAIDRERITEIAINGLGSSATTFLPPAMEWAQHPDIDFDELFPFDVDRINAGLDAAGYPVQDDGWRFTLRLRFMTAMSDTPIAAEIMQSTFEEIGVKLDLESTAATVWAETIFNQSDFDLLLMRQQVGADPSLGMAEWYSCNPESFSGRNPTGVCDEVLEEAATGALTNSNVDVRREHLYDLQERAAELMFFAPVTWTEASYPFVNTSRWQGVDAPGWASGTVNWPALEWVGD